MAAAPGVPRTAVQAPIRIAPMTRKLMPRTSVRVLVPSGAKITK